MKPTKLIGAGLVLTALEAASLLVWCRRFQAVSALGLLLVFCLAYPLIRISDYEGLLLTSLYVGLFGALGMPATAALALSLSVLAVAIVWALVGFAIFAFDRRGVSAAASESAC